MNYLSIGAIVKNEAPYIVEWIEFHRLVGVSHFFIYENGSSDGTRELLEELYVPTGLVTLHDWPMQPGQLDAYYDCLVRHRWASKWIAFIDVDEFLFSPTIQPLPGLLRRYEPYAGVAVNWCVFGTGGHVHRPEGLVIDSYRYRTRSIGLNQHVKTIAQASEVHLLRPFDPHHFIPRHGMAVVNERDRVVQGPFSRPVSFDRFRLNHYWSKSAEEARHKALQTVRADSGEARPLEAMLSRELNEERDSSITAYVPQLETRIAALRLPGHVG